MPGSVTVFAMRPKIVILDYLMKLANPGNSNQKNYDFLQHQNVSFGLKIAIR